MSSLVHLFGLESLGSLRFGDRFFSFGVVVSETILAVEVGFAVILVSSLLSTPIAFASFTATFGATTLSAAFAFSTLAALT